MKAGDSRQPAAFRRKAVKKKRKKGVNEQYKRKSNVGGWILFVVVVGVLIWYVRVQPGGEQTQAMRDPDEALKQYARIAYKVAHGETGGEATIDKLLALCTEEDAEWFNNNYARIYQREVTDRIGGANLSPPEKRNYVIKEIIDKGLNRPEYEIKNKQPLNRTVKYTLEIPGPFQQTRTVHVQMVKEGGLWKMDELGGGK
jgi:hypothetical protein